MIYWSRALLFADDTKCFGHTKSPDNEQSLQNGMNNLASWIACHNINGLGGPFMLSYLVRLDHLCIDIYKWSKQNINGPTMLCIDINYLSKT